MATAAALAGPSPKRSGCIAMATRLMVGSTSHPVSRSMATEANEIGDRADVVGQPGHADDVAADGRGEEVGDELARKEVGEEPAEGWRWRQGLEGLLPPPGGEGESDELGEGGRRQPEPRRRPSSPATRSSRLASGSCMTSSHSRSALNPTRSAKPAAGGREKRWVVEDTGISAVISTVSHRTTGILCPVTADLIDVNGGHLAVISAGHGGVPLMLHGFTGSKEDFADELHHFAELGFWAVSPDLRGHGGSHQPDDEGHYSLEIFAADVFGLADALGWERFICWATRWVGWSPS